MDISPSYRCNLNCKFCVNSKTKNKDTTLLNLTTLQSFLDSNKGIKDIGIVGGEPTLLEEEYLYNLSKICYNYNNKKVDLYTNLVKPKNLTERILENVNLIVSYDPFNRSSQKKVFGNIIKLDCDFSLNMIITKQLINEFGANKIVKLANTIKHPIHLAVLNVFDSRLNCFRANSKELIGFIKELKNSNCKFLKSTILDTLYGRRTTVKSIEEEFDQCVNLSPYGKLDVCDRYGVLHVGTKIEGNTYKECFELYKSFRTENKCSLCGLKDKCYIGSKSRDYDCEEDKKVIKIFDEI